MDKNTHNQITEVLEKNYECYILVTCGKVSEDGKMNVDMNYSGDPILASYLLEGAQSYIDGQNDNFE